MTDPVITLTTDFGEASPYAAALKGVILQINPAARILDLTHQLPPQDLRATAHFLAGSVPYFPLEVIHVVVVDPDVGTDRALLYIEFEGRRILAPDNGCWTSLVRQTPSLPRVIQLTEPRFWRQPVSATFHGRDILAPVASWLSRGTDPARLGTPVDQWVRLEEPAAVVGPDRIEGEVVFIDTFGNLLTNIPGEAFLALACRPVRVTVGTKEVPRRVRTYAEAEPGTLVALVSSVGTLEVAVRQGSAAARLGARVGLPVSVRVMP